MFRSLPRGIPILCRQPDALCAIFRARHLALGFQRTPSFLSLRMPEPFSPHSLDTGGTHPVAPKFAPCQTLSSTRNLRSVPCRLLIKVRRSWRGPRSLRPAFLLGESPIGGVLPANLISASVSMHETTQGRQGRR